jgi:ribonuclease HI
MSTSIPKACLEDIQRMQRNFIWGDTVQKRRFHAVGWQKITVPKWSGGLGLRNLDIMNKACLCKLGWKLQTGSSDLWCNVLRSKYSRNSVLNSRTTRASDSSLWKALDNVKPLMEKASLWSIGNGREIDAWKTAWIDENIALDKIIDIPSHLQNKRLFELIDDEGNWNWNLLHNWLPDDILKKIAAVAPPSIDHGPDERVLAGCSSENFSVAGMYTALSDYHGDDENTSWRRIWKLHVPERVRTFIWLMKHQRLLTNSLKSKMGVSHAMCNFCGDVEESILHVMRDCPRAMAIWNCVISTHDRGSFYMSDTQHWIDLNLHNSYQWSDSGSWSEFWALCCHCLWKWRNKELFEDDYVRPARPIQHIMVLIQEYMGAISNNKVATRSNQTVMVIRWHPPRELFVKLNTDGAYKKDQVAGCGGVIRGIHGEWLGGFAKGVGLCSAFVAELWGVYEGLRQVYRLGFRKVELNIDSEAVVRVLKRGSSSSSSGCSLLKRIWKLLEEDWLVEISHTYREANKCADALANIGCSLVSNCVFYDRCPAQIMDMYEFDLLGNSTSRLLCL